MSPNAARGFSGEGQALAGLAQKGSSEILARVKGALAWQQEKIDPASLSASLNLDIDMIHNALASVRNARIGWI